MTLFPRALAGVAADPQATTEGRAMACRKLAQVGTDNSVHVLEKLIADKDLGNPARYALARIPGKAADDALVDSLGKTSGQDQLAVAALVGQRRIESGIKDLAKLTESGTESSVVAAEALGRIGGSSALKALSKLQDKVSGNVRKAVDRAILACGETARADNDSRTAAKAYNLATADNVASPVRAAAMYGQNMLEGSDAKTSAVKMLKDSCPDIARAGARLIRDLPDNGIISSVASEIKSMPQCNQILAIDALASRGNTAAQGHRPYNGIMRQSRRPPWQRSGRCNIWATAAQSKPFISIASSQEIDQLIRDAARDSLCSMNGDGVDEAIASALRSADAAAKIEFVKVLGIRKSRAALNDLLTAARSEDNKLVKEALKIDRHGRNSRGPLSDSYPAD